MSAYGVNVEMSPTKVITTSINVLSFPPDIPFHRLLDEAAKAGFDHIELVMGSEGPLPIDIPQPDCIHIADQVHNAGLAISGLWIAGLTDANLASSNPETRQRAYQQTLAALDRAVWLGCDTVILSPAAMDQTDPSSQATPYEETYTQSLEALLRLRFEAQNRAVHIACRSATNRFLLSPMEMRDFIDHINSPWIGACLDLAGLSPYGLPHDWILTMGHRIRSVHLNDVKIDEHGRRIVCPLGEGDIDWPDVASSLHRITYQGPIVYRGDYDDLTIAHTRLSRILND